MLGRFASARCALRAGCVASLTMISVLAVGTLAPAHAEEGIAGRIVSAETGQPLGFANVLYTCTDPGAEATKGGAMARGDGSFRIVVPPGTYQLQVQYIGYAVVTVTDVVVKAGELTTVDPAMGSKTIKIDTVKVSGKSIKNTDQALLARRKRAAAVSDGISAEQIKTSTDGNAAEVVTRVTGVSLVDGKYVYVRGLGERYSAAQVNGSPVASPEANRKVLPFDIFPSGFLDNVVIQKTYTPDQPGEFGGGVVNVTTLDFPVERTWNLTVASGGHSGTTGEDFATYQGGHTDYLGITDGIRSIPNLVEELAGDRPIRRKGIASPGGFTPDSIALMGQSFNKIWSPKIEQGQPQYNGSMSYGDGYEILGRRLGVIAAGSFSNTFHTYDYHSTDYQSLTTDGSLETLSDFDINRSSAETLLGGLVNTGIGVASGHDMNLRAMYNRSSDDQVRLTEGPTTDLPIRRTRLRYVERGLFTASGGMTHRFAFLGGTTLDWRAEVSQAEQNEPDRRQYDYELQDRVDANGDSVQVYELSRRSASAGFTRSFSELDDTERNYAANLDVPFRQWAGLESHAKVGWTLRNKDRDSWIRRFAFRNPQSNQPDYSQSPDELLAGENVGGANGTFRLEELTRSSDAYVAKHDLQAGYAMVDVPIGQRLRLITGARLEASNQKVVTRSNIVGGDPEVGEIDEHDVLPAANVRFAVLEDLNIRAAYSRTLNRPDLREMTAQEYSDYDRDRSYMGNPDLDQATMDSWDLRFEAFPSAEEIVAVSGFTKSIRRPIEYQVFQGTGSGEFVRQPVNGEKGFVRGLELEGRLALGRFATTLDRFGLSANLTLVESEAELALASDRSGRVRHPLTGQSPYVGNAALAFATPSGATSSSIQYNVFGRRLEASGPVDEFGNAIIPDIYEQPRHMLDFTATQRWGGARIKLAVENILGEEYRTEQGNQPAEVRELGYTVSLSLGYGSR